MSSEAKYGRLGNDYHWVWAAQGPANAYRRWTHRVMACLPADGGGATLLEVGSGDGYPASKLVERGYEVTGVETVEGALGVARAKVPGATFGTAYPDAPVDYVLALESIVHLADSAPLVDAVRACRQFALISCPPPGKNPYAVAGYDRAAIEALFEGCAVEHVIDEGEHQLYKIVPGGQNEDRDHQQRAGARERGDGERPGPQPARPRSRAKSTRPRRTRDNG